MKKLATHWQIIIALVAAVLVATLLKQAGDVAWVNSTLKICTLLGDLFLQALKMIIVPLVVSSIIAGLAGLAGFDGFKRMGLKTLGFYLLSTLSAVVLGLLIVNVMQPGLVDGQPNAELREVFDNAPAGTSDSDKERFATSRQDQAKDWTAIFKRMLPQNIIKAGAEDQLLGLLVFSLMFGIAMTQFPADQMQPMRDFFQNLNDIMIKITQWIMITAPIGIFGMMVGTVYKSGAEVFQQLGPYFFTVLLALALHMFLVLPLLLKIVGRVSPIAHFKAMKTALLTAFSTSSSSATLPVTMRCVQDNAGVSKKTASFTLPLGATVNMDGTALYECIAVIFVAQVMGLEMTFTAQMLVVISALLTSIGVAGVPSASMVAILIIMNNSGIPGADNAILALFAVDRLLDMSRTAVNVFGDSCAAVVIAKSEGETLYQNNP
ncbi:MAG: dicarboxylate/amino acid:cation symporter [Akkermansiaceae bacterium]